MIVDVRPEVEAELTRQAALCGRLLEDYAAALLEEAAGDQTGQLVMHEGCGPNEASSEAAKAANLMELFAPVRGLLTDEEVDTLFSRNPSVGRPTDFG